MKPGSRFFVNCYYIEKSASRIHKEALVSAIATNTEFSFKQSVLDVPASSQAICENKSSPSALQFVEMIDEDGMYVMPPKLVEALGT